MNAQQVIEAIKADKRHTLNLPHNTITGAVQSEEKPNVWVVSFETTWGLKGTRAVRVEFEDGEIEIW